MEDYFYTPGFEPWLGPPSKSNPLPTELRETYLYDL